MCIDDCRNSTVINSPVIECDGINDCEDGNDEFNCCKLKYKKIFSIVHTN